MKNAYSVEELAARWSVSPQTVRRAFRAGRIPTPLRIGAQLRWPREDIERYEQCQVEGGADGRAS